MLSTEISKAAHVLDYESTEMTLQHNKTNFVQIPPRTETGLIAKGKNAVDRSTRSITACFHLSLLTHKRVKFSLCRFDVRPSDPTKFKQPNRQLPKKMESRVIVAANDNLRTDTAQSLPDCRTRSNCREDGAHKILEEATTVSTKFFAEEAAVDLLKRCEKTGSLQEKLFRNCPKARMIRKHVCLPLLDHGQITTQLHLLQKTIHKSGKFTECQIPVVSPPRVQFGEIVCN